MMEIPEHLKDRVYRPVDHMEDSDDSRGLTEEQIKAIVERQQQRNISIEVDE
jgi:hypothetical protein